MDLESLVTGIPDFPQWTHAEKIRFFSWFIHSKLQQERFSPGDIRKCYAKLTLEQPRDINPYLHQMFSRKPREVLRDSKGYALERRVRDGFEDRYGKRPTTINVDKLLVDLPSKIPELAEQTFLDEAIRCFRVQAFRATIVMVWNLAYDHLCDHIFKDALRLQDFNTQLPKSYPRSRISCIKSKDDFGELKESEVLQVVRSANLISNDLHKILIEKLSKRNSAAHPSNIVIVPHTAEEFVLDLINNVVLKLQ